MSSVGFESCPFCRRALIAVKSAQQFPNKSEPLAATGGRSGRRWGQLHGHGSHSHRGLRAGWMLYSTQRDRTHVVHRTYGFELRGALEAYVNIAPDHAERMHGLRLLDILLRHYSHCRCGRHLLHVLRAWCCGNCHAITLSLGQRGKGWGRCPIAHAAEYASSAAVTRCAGRAEGVPTPESTSKGLLIFATNLSTCSGSFSSSSFTCMTVRALALSSRRLGREGGVGDPDSPTLDDWPPPLRRCCCCC